MKYIKGLAKYLSVALVLFVFMAPMLWALINSFKTTSELLSFPPTFLPREATIEHYLNLWDRVPFGRYYLNSVLVGLSTALITAILGTLAAYSVYRCRYRGRILLFRGFLTSYMFPKVLVLIPLFILFSRIGIYDTPFALIGAHVTMSVPFSVWILRAFFESVPIEVEDAARIDGATRIQTVFRIFIPLTAPGVAAVAINSFLMSWTDYLFASVYVMSEAQKTLPVGLAYFLVQYEIDWGIMMAGSVLIAIPPVIGFAVAGRYFIQGLTAGSVK